MTKQDHKLIASTLAGSLRDAPSVDRVVIYDVISDLADALEADNPRFRRTMFIEAILAEQ